MGIYHPRISKQTFFYQLDGDNGPAFCTNEFWMASYTVLKASPKLTMSHACATG